MTKMWRHLRRWLRWIAVGMPRLDCSCPNDGRPIYSCMRCSHCRCVAHRDDHSHRDSKVGADR